ncbi:class I SAM-dependent methyltransferase [Chloroflexota bacterium]
MATSENLKEVFNEIAPGWYGFRHWTIFCRELEVLAERWRKGRLVNIGCAHGPDFLPFRQHFDLYGVDFSGEMLKFARKYLQKFNFAAELVLADFIQLPFADEVFDWAISVATYHHIKGENETKTALKELRRVLKPNGEAFITVWNYWQPRFWLGRKEVVVPWRAKDKVLERYYYLFSYGELEKLVKQAGFQVLKSFPESSYRLPVKYFSRNICLLVRKSIF